MIATWATALKEKYIFALQNYVFPMRSFAVLFLILCSSFYSSQAQSHWHKLRIPLEGKTIGDLQKTGLAFDHGQYKPGVEFVGDFTHEEMEKLEAAGFKPVVIPSRLVLDSRTGDPCDSIRREEPTFNTPREYPFGSMNGFPTLTEIYESLDLMAELYPKLVTGRQRIGNFLTEEGQPIYYVKISDNPEREENEPEILYTALHHAREPISATQMLFYMWYLLENYSSNPEIKRLVDSRAMYFVACVNPDGYLYNQQTNPRGEGFWRKNRKELPEGYGVDLNRNYGYKWGFNNTGSSNEVESEVYRGPWAFSEVETQALRSFCNSRNFKIALNYHSHGDILIIPWGYSNVPTPDSSAYLAMARQFTQFNKFRVGTTFNTLNYEVNGVSDDWMYANNNIFAFTPEVGYAFWPERKDIMSLNHSVQHMNVMAAWNAAACARMTDVSPVSLNTPSGVLEIHLQRTGLEDQPIEISALVSPQGKINLIMPGSIRLAEGSETVVKIPYSLNPGIQYGDPVQIKLQLTTGDYVQDLVLDKIYLGRPIWQETGLDLNNWVASGSPLTTTTESFSSAPSSITDSPNGPVVSSREYRMITRNPIDLSHASNAYLSYRLKWDLDKEVDFAQVKVSEDGFSFTPLCGQYTVLGSSFQDLDKPVYTGKQDHWVSEWVDLRPFLGKKIHLQLFVATNYSEFTRDGFYIDDITVYSDIINSSSQPQTAESFQVYPQPASEVLNLKGKVTDLVEFSLCGTDGLRHRLSWTHRTETNIELNLPELAPGLYVLQAIRRDGQTEIRKVSIH